MASLTFLGATETVTGSRYLVETPDARVLVDCGRYQGLKELRLRNWAPRAGRHTAGGRDQHPRGRAA